MVVAILGALAAVVVPTIQGGPDAAKKAKLEQDVIIVNNAIDAYLAAGGSQGALSAGGVIEALKQRVAGSGITAEMAGSFGPFLDPRVRTNASDFDWSARFEISPRPRFVVQNSPNGVVFGRGPASAVGGPTAGTKPSWLWSYAPASATNVSKPVFEPTTIDAGTTLGTTNALLTGLSCPDISPASQTLNLDGFPLLVSVANPNPGGSSIAYYKIGSGNWVLYTGAPFTVDPGANVTAVAVSIDPSRYYNSSVCSESYEVTPWPLAITVSAPASVTYADAGGLMAGQAQLSPSSVTISLTDAGNIPAPYLSSAYFTVRYTADGTDPLTSATALSVPSFSGSFPPIQVPLELSLWGTNDSVSIRAVAVSSKPEWFSSSAVEESTTTKALTPLSLDVVPVSPIGLPVQVVVNETGEVPEGLRKYYTTTGASPLSSPSAGVPSADANLYTGPVSAADLPASGYTLTAQATGPVGYESWFASQPVTRSYNTVGTLPSEFVGANISGGDVNGTFAGSIFVSAPADLGIFNAGGQIRGGNLYVPGMPAIQIPGSGKSSKTVAAAGQPYAEGGQIPRTLIGGKEFTSTGELAEPQLDTRQIVDLNGSVSPTNYTVKLTKSAFIEGKIYRRADPPPPPTVPVVPDGLATNTTNYTGLFTNQIPSGVYSNTITMNNDDSVLRLGVPGATSQYVFVGNTWNKGSVEILGSVEIFFLDGFDNKGVAFGNAGNIAQASAAPLRINVMTNGVDITGGGSVYAALWAGNSAMVVGNVSSFFGSLYAETLKVDPGGTVNVE